MKVIANKRIEVTPDEFRLYENIAAQYPDGKQLFQGLFETDEDGIITCLIPPKKKFAMDVVIYLQNLLVHQHMRLIYKEHNEAMQELRALMVEARKVISELKPSSDGE